MKFILVALLTFTLLCGIAAADDSALPDDALITQTEDTHWDAESAGILDFSRSHFGTEHLTAGQPPQERAEDDPDYTFAVAYISKANRHVDAEEVAKLIVDTGIPYPAVPLRLMLPIIKRESNFRYGAHNQSTNCYGLCQLMHCYHAGPMNRMGMEWHDPGDNLRYSYNHVQVDYERYLKLGYKPERALRKACSWWEVIPGAWAEYLTLKGDEGANLCQLSKN